MVVYSIFVSSQGPVTYIQLEKEICLLLKKMVLDALVVDRRERDDHLRLLACSV